MSASVTVTNAVTGPGKTVAAATVFSGVSEVVFRPDANALILNTAKFPGPGPVEYLDVSGCTTCTITGFGTTALVVTAS